MWGPTKPLSSSLGARLRLAPATRTSSGQGPARRDRSSATHWILWYTAARVSPEVSECPGGGQAVPATPPPGATSRAWTPVPPGETRREDNACHGSPGWRAPHAGGLRDAPRRAECGGPAGAG